MQVLLDCERLRNLNSGLGQFCLSLGRNLVSKTQKNEIDFTAYRPAILGSVFGGAVNYKDSNSFHKLFRWPTSEDILHCMHQDSYLMPSSPLQKMVLTIHDLNFLTKEYSKRKIDLKIRNLQKKVDRASAVTFISNYSRDDAMQYIDLKNKVVKVIYNGLVELVSSPVKKPDYINCDRFIFTIGIVSPKKNFKTLIPLLTANRQLSLVIAGENKNAYAQEIVQLAAELKVADRLIMPGQIGEEEKSWLYSNCEAFVFPSIAEGFGLPVIEAMSFGKPVFLSNATSLPEIGGKEAYFFNTFESQDMNRIFESGMSNYRSDIEKSERIKNHARSFSWSSAADQYIELYKSI